MTKPIIGNNESNSLEESYYMASQWQLMWRKFRKHKLAITGAVILIILYFGAVFSGFLSPYDIYERHSNYVYAPPQKIRFFDEEGFNIRPFVYGYNSRIDRNTFQRVYEIDKTKKYPIYFLVKRHKYKLWNLFETNLHLFGVEGNDSIIFVFGTDALGRDLFSRIIYASRISLSIGLVGVALNLIIGCTLGGISGFYGGIVDDFIQRLIEFIRSIPTIPLWLGLSAALPKDWPMIKVYFAITIILSIVGWTLCARTVRGHIISISKEDFVTAAKVCGMTDIRIIKRHLLPSFMSYIIVSITLSIPAMILGETSLSFLGLGLRAPVVSWGVLLQKSQNITNVAMHPWLLIPALFVIFTVLAFNFLGDGLRDAADPYR